jgi:hypothetical protein
LADPQQFTPLLVDPADYGRWLDHDREDAWALAVPYADERMAQLS